MLVERPFAPGPIPDFDPRLCDRQLLPAPLVRRWRLRDARLSGAGVEASGRNLRRFWEVVGWGFESNTPHSRRCFLQIVVGVGW